MGLSLAFTGCGRQTEDADKGATKEGRSVRVAVVSATPGWDEEEVVGNVEAAQKAVLSAKVTGVMDAIKVAPGSKITFGEVLATIDAREMHA